MDMDIKKTLEPTESRIEEIIDSVLERGYDDSSLQSDDYICLLQRGEFRQLVIFDFYDVYFPPKRHEFDLELITQFVIGVLTGQQAMLIGTFALSGIVGNASYEILKSILKSIIKKFEGHEQRQEPFIEISQNAKKIVEFFENKDSATIREISDSIGVEEEKLSPLLKLLGYRCKRRKKKSIWFKPSQAS